MRDIITDNYKGLYSDSLPDKQPNNTYPYALNAICSYENFLSNEESNIDILELPDGFSIVGDIKIENDKNILFLYSSNSCSIGLFTNNEYKEIINSTELNFSKFNKIRGISRKRINGDRIIYWVDGLNKPRSINIDKLENYYSDEYVYWLESSDLTDDSIINMLINDFINSNDLEITIEEKITLIYQYYFNVEVSEEIITNWKIIYNESFNDSDFIYDIIIDNINNEHLISLIENKKNNIVFTNEKWNVSKFNLIKEYSEIPKFESVRILSNGNILPGSYSFAVQLLDNDLNATNWITTSNTVNIYNDSLNNSYETIRGSRNINSALMSYGKTNKSIELIISNFDPNYSFYRVAIIQSNNMTGIANKVLVDEIKSISESVYVYSGNDESLSEISLSEIAIDKEYIDDIECIEQLENRLILANGSDTDINFINFQNFASKISSHLTTKKIYLNSINSKGNNKNGTSSFDSIGYMPGEVYSFGIVYVMDDGSYSPVFHIPGRNYNNIRPLKNGFNDNLDYYENENSYYPDIHSELGVKNYWGIDDYGEQLVGRNKRFHKFPTRKNRGLFLYEKSEEAVNIYKYKLSLEISLKSNAAYPLNSLTGEAKTITCNINYLLNNSDNINEYTTLITNETENNIIKKTIYFENEPLKYIDEINEKYAIVSGEIEYYSHLFDINFNYEEILEEILQPAYYTDILGIRFENIEKPHEKVKGYFIVRNKREDADKLIIDNAIIGNTVKQTFGSVTYDVFNKWTARVDGETVDKDNNIGSSGSQRDLSQESLYFFSPEHQFLNSQLSFTHVDIQGMYTTERKMTSLNNGEPSNTGNYDIRPYSIIIADTMEGTSFNSEVHENPDEDGFNLVIGYRNINPDYTITFNDFNLNDSEGESTIEEIFYINATSSKLYNGITYYNVCQDNKIGIIKVKNSNLIYNTVEEKLNLFNDQNKRNIYYGSLMRNNTSSYSNFIDRNYYKEHNNIISFRNDNISNTVNIFNGDSYVVSMTLMASSYYGMQMADRKKKDKKSSGLLGVALIIVGVAATIFTAGAAIGIFGALSIAQTVAITALGAMALSAGASMYSANLRLEELKKMINEEYPKGLQATMCDIDMSEDPSISEFGCGLKHGTRSTDDSIIWFSDRLTDIFIETSINVDLRTSLTNMGIDFINSLNPVKNSEYQLADGIKVTTPRTVNLDGFDESEFRAYLTEKLTVVDPEHDDGRIYRGYANTEWYDVNPDYMRKNTEKVFIHLPVDYIKPPENSKKYRNRIWYSQQSFQEESVDNYKVFLSNNYRDIESKYGAINNLFTINNSLFILTEENIWQLPQNLQEKITNELTTYIGTGEFLTLPPINIGNNFGGSNYKDSILKTEKGVIIIDTVNRDIYCFANNAIDNLSNKGLQSFFYENLKNFLQSQLKIDGILYGINIICGYDSKNDRLLVTKKDYELIDVENFKGEYDYKNIDYTINNKIVIDNELQIIDNIKYSTLSSELFNEFEVNNVVNVNTFNLINNNSLQNGSVIKLNPYEIRYIPPVGYIGEDRITIVTDNKCNSMNDILIKTIDDINFVDQLPFSYIQTESLKDNYRHFANLSINDWGSIPIIYLTVKEGNNIIIDKEKIYRFLKTAPFTISYFLGTSENETMNYEIITTYYATNDSAFDKLIITNFLTGEVSSFEEEGMIISKYIDSQTYPVIDENDNKTWSLYGIIEDSKIYFNNKTTIPHTISIKYNDKVILNKSYESWENNRNKNYEIDITYIENVNSIIVNLYYDKWISSTSSINEQINFSITL